VNVAAKGVDADLQSAAAQVSSLVSLPSSLSSSLTQQATAGTVIYDHLILSYLILSYLILSYLIFSYPITLSSSHLMRSIACTRMHIHTRSLSHFCTHTHLHAHSLTHSHSQTYTHSTLYHCDG
jgi:hypothetical protein